MTKRNLRGCLARGLEALGNGRLVLLLAVTTVALALPAAFALWPALSSAFGGTLAGDHVLRNHPSFAPLDVFEFFYEKRDAVAGARRVALGAGVLGVLLQVFYAGGFVETLGRGPRIPLAHFLAGALRNCWHNVKCFSIFLLASGVVIGLWLVGTAAAAKKLFEQTPPGATSSLLFRVATLLIASLLFILFSLLHDFARIARRHETAIGAWRGYGFARRVLSGSWRTAFGLFILWLLAGGIAWFLIVALEWGTPAVSGAAICLHTLLQLAAVLLRSGVRVAAWGSYVALADARTGFESTQSAVRGPETPVAPPAEPLSPMDFLGAEAPPT